MSVNGNVCWSKRDLLGTDGTQLCGGRYKEELFRVTGCYVELSAASKAMAPLTVCVWTNLDGDADDESFGIDNVVISKLKEGDTEGLETGNHGVKEPCCISTRMCIHKSARQCAYDSVFVESPAHELLHALCTWSRRLEYQYLSNK